MNKTVVQKLKDDVFELLDGVTLKSQMDNILLNTFFDKAEKEEKEQQTSIELPSDEEIEKIAQWIIDNRYAKSELNKVSDFEMYHHIIKLIKEQILKQTNVGNDGFEFDNSSTIPPTKGLCDAKSIYGERELTVDERMHLWFVDKRPNRDVCDSVDELSDEEKHKYFDECNITRTIQIDIPTIINK